MPTNNHSSQLTARDIHEAYAQAYTETYTKAQQSYSGKEGVSICRVSTWEQVNHDEKAAYERMAALLNERIK